MYTQTEKVNIEPKSYLPVFRISQNDIGRTLKAHLISDDGEITIPTSATVTMAGIKPSGLGYTVTGTINGSDVTFETDATMTDEAGQIESEIRIVDGETLIGTTNVVLNIEPNPHPDDTTDGQREPLVNEITALLNQITAQADRVEEYSSKVLNMTVSAHESQEPTVAKTEGEVVNLDFGLPRGEKGERGERGERGEAGKDGKDGKDGIDGKDGKDGINGVTPDFSIGTVTTLEPTESASVTLTGTEEEPVLNFGIPKGAKGEQGEVSLSDLEKIMVTDTASGAIASFPDGSDLLPALSLVANIVPKQSGSGTPSPENVRPISGWTEVTVFDTGVNVWDEEWEVGLISAATGQNETNSNYSRTKNYCKVVPDTNYYIKNTPSPLYLREYGANKEYIRYAQIAGNNEITIPSDVYYIRFCWDGTTYNNDISINYPSTDHEYHAFNPNSSTTTTSLGRTVYGGTVDVVSGVLTVTHAIVDLGTLLWSRKTDGVFYSWGLQNLVKAISNTTITANGVCSALQMGSYNAVYNNATLDNAIAVGADSQLGAHCSNYTTAADFKSAMQGVQLCYELATPQTYQLTPQTINTLSGVNNVWADSGDCSITYYADTKLYIDKKLGGN